jgi:hypothetical protein
MTMAGLLGACGPPATPTVSSAMASSGTGADCDAEHGEEQVVLEMGAADRATLEAASMEELVAVAYEGCAVRVLTDCGLTGTYELTETPVEGDVIEVDDSLLLPNLLPLFVPGFGAHVSSGQTLRLEYKIRGQRRADVSAVRADQLAGGCESATHVVRAMSIGAFELSMHDRVSGGGAVPLGDEGGISGSHRESRRSSSTVGDLDACGSEDPSGCSAVVKLDLVPLS